MGDLFGVAVSPFELEEWQDATSIRPDLCMVFESWSRQRALTELLDKAKSFGHDSIALTWEPWAPTPVGTPSDEQGENQEQWSHASILAGEHDDYIDLVARSLRDSKLTVYLRFAHEMNGGWYPWHNDAGEYIAAWRYVRHRIRSMRNAWNVKLIWAPNPDLWRATPADWLVRLMPYWPGPAAVENVGFTMIDFGSDRYYPVSLFAERFELARRIFRKDVLAMEVNVARENAIPWLGDLADYVRRGPLSVLILSQGSSRAAAAGDTGDLAWSAASDPEAREALRRVVDALHAT